MLAFGFQLSSLLLLLLLVFPFLSFHSSHTVPKQNKKLGGYIQHKTCSEYILQKGGMPCISPKNTHTHTFTTKMRVISRPYPNRHFFCTATHSHLCVVSLSFFVIVFIFSGCQMWNEVWVTSFRVVSQFSFHVHAAAVFLLWNT